MEFDLESCLAWPILLLYLSGHCSPPVIPCFWVVLSIGLCMIVETLDPVPYRMVTKNGF